MSELVETVRVNFEQNEWEQMWRKQTSREVRVVLCGRYNYNSVTKSCANYVKIFQFFILQFFLFFCVYLGIDTLLCEAFLKSLWGFNFESFLNLLLVTDPHSKDQSSWMQTHLAKCTYARCVHLKTCTYQSDCTARIWPKQIHQSWTWTHLAKMHLVSAYRRDARCIYTDAPMDASFDSAMMGWSIQMISEMISDIISNMVLRSSLRSSFTCFHGHILATFCFMPTLPWINLLQRTEQLIQTLFRFVVFYVIGTYKKLQKKHTKQNKNLNTFF